MNKPEISVIVANYNNYQYLVQCIESLLKQTIESEKYEIIIVDDCSQDGSVELLRRYSAENSNIKVIYKGQNEGLLYSRIDGAKYVRGKYIVFVDSDDWVSSDMCEKIIGAFQKREADIIEFGHICENGIEANEKYQIKNTDVKIHDIIKEYTERKIDSFIWLRVYKKEIIVKGIEILERALEKREYLNTNTDDEFLFPTFLNVSGSYHVVKECFYHYRNKREGSLTEGIEANERRRLEHSFLLFKAGSIILRQVDKNRMLYALYFWMQTNNLFYIFGNVQRYFNKISDTDAVIVKGFIEEYIFVQAKIEKWYNGKWSDIWRIEKRKIHLCIKAMKIKSDLKRIAENEA